MPESTWQSLLAAHETARRPNVGEVPDHRPGAAVLCCSDARVPPSAVFGQSHGDLFVVRNAGNLATPVAVASLDYAVSDLGVDLVIVMGHTQCGAVNAALNDTSEPHLEPVVGPILELLADEPDLDAGQLIEKNILSALDTLAASGGPVGESIRVGDVQIVGALYDLATDSVVEISAPTDTREPRHLSEPQ